MSVFARLAPVSVASVAAIGLVAPVVVAPPAAAAPCSQTAAAAAPNRIQPLPGAAMPPVEHVPTGRMPRGAQNQAVPSRLGPLPAASDPAATGALNFAPMQQEGAVLPLPVPGLPGAAGQQVPNLTGPTTGAPAAAIAAPDDNDRQLGGWTQQPEQHIHTLRHLGRRSRDYVGQRPNRRERPGAHRIRRHVRRLQRLRPAMAEQHLVSQRGPQSVRRSVGARSRVRQRLRRLAGPVRDSTGIELLKTDHRQSQSRPNRSHQSSPPPESQWGQHNTSISCRSSSGAIRANGPRTSRQSRLPPTTAKIGPSTVEPSARAGFSAYPESGSTGATRIFSRGRSFGGDGYLYSFGTPSGRSGSAYVSRVPENAVLDLSQYEYWSKPWWNFLEQGRGSRTVPGPPRRLSRLR